MAVQSFIFFIITIIHSFISYACVRECASADSLCASLCWVRYPHRRVSMAGNVILQCGNQVSFLFPLRVAGFYCLVRRLLRGSRKEAFCVVMTTLLLLLRDSL